LEVRWLVITIKNYCVKLDDLIYWITIMEYGNFEEIEDDDDLTDLRISILEEKLHETEKLIIELREFILILATRLNENQ